MCELQQHRFAPQPPPFTVTATVGRSDVTTYSDLKNAWCSCGSCEHSFLCDVYLSVDCSSSHGLRLIYAIITMGCCGSTATKPSSLQPLPTPAVDQRELVQSIQLTYAPSSTGTPRAPSVAPPSEGSSRGPAPDAAQYQTFTLLPQPHAITPVRRRSQGPEPFLSRGGGGQAPKLDSFMSLDSRNPPTGIRVGSRPLAEGNEGQPRFPSALKSLLSNDFRYAVSRRLINYYYHSSVYRFRILVVGKVRVFQSDMPWTQLMHVSSQRESGKSSLINAVFKVNMSVCT